VGGKREEGTNGGNMWGIWIVLILSGLFVSSFAIIDRELSIEPHFTERECAGVALFGIVLEIVGLVAIW